MSIQKIKIQSPGATTWLPWNGTEPDFSQFEEPSLSVIKEAWKAGKNNIEVIPDPILIVELPEPNWQGFGGALQQSQVYISNISNPFLLTITAFIIQFAGSGDNPRLYPSFSIAWGGFVQSINGFSEIERNEINTACSVFNMTFSVGVDGLLIL